MNVGFDEGVIVGTTEGYVDGLVVGWLVCTNNVGTNEGDALGIEVGTFEGYIV